MKKNKKILIVGGGLGGLATAICLSDKNFEISIIEKNSNLGGKYYNLSDSILTDVF